MPRPLLAALFIAGCGGAPLTGAALNAHLESACHDADTADERDLLERELLEHARLEVRMRAVSSTELAARTGTRLYRDDVVLMAFDVLDHGQPCCSQLTEVTLASGGRDWRMLQGGDVWRHAGLEPPVAAQVSSSYSPGGLAADAFIALLTIGLVDLKLRGEGNVTVTPGRRGTGTPEQKTAIGLIGASLTDPPERSFYGWMDHYVVLLVPPDPPPAPSETQELVVRVTFDLGESSRSDEEHCPFVVERRVPIPAGDAPTGARLQRVLDAEPSVVIGSLPP